MKTGQLGFELALVNTKLAANNAKYYFLTWKLFFIGLIEIMITIFTLFLELTNHYQASILK